MDVDRAIDELYDVTPEEFIATRDALIEQARSDGDAAAASQLRKVRKPSRSAWLVNQLVRHRSDEIDRLLELGSALREAQANLRGEDLRRLAEQRRQVVTALANEGRQLAAELGESTNEGMRRDVETTLNAALSDPEAADLVRSGRLTAALSHSGFGVDVSDTTGPAVRAQKASTPTKQDEKRDQKNNGGAAAKQALADARARLKEAEKEERAEEAAFAKASARREQTVRRVAQLEEDLAHARQEDAAAAEEVRAAHRRRDTAAKSLNAARQRVERAEAASKRN